MSRSRACCPVFLLLLLLGPPDALAAILCGTVRDAMTLEPVSGAGIFVYDTTGVYAGFHATSNEQGAFCIDGLTAGTYDLRLLVDDYQSRWVQDVVVEEGQSGIDVLVPLTVRLSPPAPNPASAEVSIHYRAPAGGFARLTILDVSGRWIRGWAAAPLVNAGIQERVAATSGDDFIEGTVCWDLTDSAGRRVSPGCYYARLDVAGSASVRTVLVVE